MSMQEFQSLMGKVAASLECRTVDDTMATHLVALTRFLATIFFALSVVTLQAVGFSTAAYAGDFTETGLTATTSTGTVTSNGVSGTYALERTAVSGFAGIFTTDGASGLEASNLPAGSGAPDSYSWNLNVIPPAGYLAQITVSQSAYITIGNSEAQTITLTWPGAAGLATVSDTVAAYRNDRTDHDFWPFSAFNASCPDPSGNHQIRDFADGDTFASGTPFSIYAINNNRDAWSVTTPLGENTVTLSTVIDDYTQNPALRTSVATACTPALLNPVGEAYREWMTFNVEFVSIFSDFSDAPTTGTSYGEATHEVTAGLQLGAAIDVDAASIANADASGDGADDDGVSSVPDLVETATGDYTIPQGNLSGTGSGTLHAWVDFNDDGSFDAGEYASVGFNNGATGDLTFSGYGTVANAGTTFARFRLTTVPLTSADAATYVSDGEVEDYPVTIQSSTPPTAELDVAKSASVGPLQADGTFDVEYAITVVNTGDVTLDPLTLVDDLTAVDQLGSTFNGVTATGAPVVTAGAISAGSTLPSADGAYDGTAGLITSSGVLIPGDSFEVTFSVNIDPNAAGAPASLDNTATASGVPPGGTPGVDEVSDDSDTDSDPAGDPDGTPNVPGGPGDPTPVTPPVAMPQLDVAKSASVGPLQADGTFDVEYAITVVNTGDVTLDPLTLVDDLTAVDQLGSTFNGVTATGAPVVTAGAISAGSTLPSADGAYDGTAGLITSSGVLIPGDSFEVTFSVNIDPNAAGAPASLDNTATASGVPPGGTPGVDEVSDDSDTDSDPAGDPDGTPNVPGGPGDPTPVTPPVAMPQLDVAKSASVGPLQADGTFDVEYAITVVNTGDVTLDPLTLVDDLTAADQLGSTFNGVTATGAPVVTAGAISAGSTLPSADGAYDGTAGLITSSGVLIPGDSFEVTFSVNIDPNAAGAPASLDNTATASGVPPGGTPGVDEVSDDSDTDSDPAGDPDGTPNVPGGPGDPTPVTPPVAMPQIQLTKNVGTITDVNMNGFTDAGDIIEWTFIVTNTGDQDLTDISIADDVADVVVGNVLTGPLAPGEFDDTTFTASYEITLADVQNGGVENTATVAASDPSGDPVEDVSDTGAGTEETDDDDLGEPGDPNGPTPDDNDPTNDPTVTPFGPVADLSVLKSIASVNDVNNNGSIDAGDELNYVLEITNTGNIDLVGVSLADTGATITPSGTVDIAIGDTDTTFTGVYALTAADVAAGSYENVATATGRGVDSNGDVIPNLPSVTDTSDTGTEPQLDSNGDPIEVMDPEDTDSPDSDGTMDGDPENDPTVFFIPTPEIRLTKTVARALDTNGDGLFGGENDEIVYAFLVENVGNTDLVGVTVSDPLFAATGGVQGGPIDLAIGQGDSTTFTGSYIVQAVDLELGYVENTATATGDAELHGAPVYGPDGTPLTASDVSDTGTDPDGEDVPDNETTKTPDGEGDTNDDPSDDPTVLTVPSNPRPAIDLIKSITNIVDNDRDDLLSVGDDVTYTFTVTNVGNVRLGDVTIVDPLTGTDVNIGALEVLEENATATGTYTLLDSDIANGFVNNTATVSGGAVNSAGDPLTEPNGGPRLTAENDSDTGTEPVLGADGLPVGVVDPNGTETPDGADVSDSDPSNDPTSLLLPSPEISVIKSVAQVLDTNNSGLFGDTGDRITYTFEVTNTGGTDLSNVVVTDANAVMSGGPIAFLAVGDSDSTTFTASHIVTSGEFAQGYVENTAEVSADALDSSGDPILGLDGTPVSVTDTSDTGTEANGDDIDNPEGEETPDGEDNTNGDPTDDPTVVTVPVNPMPEISLIKSITAVVDTNGDQVTGNAGDEVFYSFLVTNTGNTALANVTVEDPLLGGVVGVIALLDTEASETLSGVYILTDDDVTAGFVQNTATVEGDSVNDAGDPIRDPITGEELTAQDTSDTGSTPEATPISDPENVETPDADGVTDTDPGNDPTVLTVPLTPSPASITGTVFVDNDRSDPLDFDPDNDTGLGGYTVNLIDPDGNLVGIAISEPDGTYTIAGFSIVAGDYSVEFESPDNEVIGGFPLGVDFTTDPVQTDVDQGIATTIAPDFTLTKVASVSDVTIGQTVTYTIVATNLGTTSFGPVTIADVLPVGLIYTPDTATVNGVATEPGIAGQRLTWTGLTLPVGETEVVLNVRVGPSAPFGNIVNTADLLDGLTGEPLTQSATAVVTRSPEAVFECSDIIGKVFDDIDRDGYQDPIGENSAAITDQTYVGGKFDVIPDAPRQEHGLPGVRLVTTDGTIITTDEYGRYSVPCAALPGPIGENFTLKLDTNSLPTGYRMTNENPRTMRVTSGIMTEMNFGASIGRVVDVDLTASAFDAQHDPVDELVNGLDGLFTQINDTPSVLRITYFTNGESGQVADARLDALEDVIRSKWRRIGNYRLVIERTFTRLQ